MGEKEIGSQDHRIGLVDGHNNEARGTRTKQKSGQAVSSARKGFAAVPVKRPA